MNHSIQQNNQKSSSDRSSILLIGYGCSPDILIQAQTILQNHGIQMEGFTNPLDAIKAIANADWITQDTNQNYFSNQNQQQIIQENNNSYKNNNSEYPETKESIQRVEDTTQNHKDSIQTNQKQTHEKLDLIHEERETSHGAIESNQEKCEPIHKEHEPIYETFEIIKESSESIIKSTDPIQESTDPIQESTDLIQESTAPIQESTAPIQKSSDSTQKRTAPIEKSTDPIQESIAPIQETSDSIQESSESIQERNQPIQKLDVMIQEKDKPITEQLTEHQENTRLMNDTDNSKSQQKHKNHSNWKILKSNNSINQDQDQQENFSLSDYRPRVLIYSKEPKKSEETYHILQTHDINQIQLCHKLLEIESLIADSRPTLIIIETTDNLNQAILFIKRVSHHIAGVKVMVIAEEKDMQLIESHGIKKRFCLSHPINAEKLIILTKTMLADLPIQKERKKKFHQKRALSDVPPFIQKQKRGFINRIFN